MSTPLPVPSKVAVTAIRGLIVGTTCSLALITEDRRRRIKNAHNAIRNAERIRSAKNYHAGGASLALAIEEDAALFDPSYVPPTAATDRWNIGRARSIPRERQLPHAINPASTERQPETADTFGRRQDSFVGQHSEDARGDRAPVTQKPARARIKEATVPPPIRLHAEQHKTSVLDAAGKKLKTSTTSGRSPFAFPRTDEIRTMIKQATSSKSRELLDQAHSLVVQALTAEHKGVPLDNPMIDVCALLCRTCQDMGNFDAAREVLELVLERGPVSEAAYYSFQPLELLDEIVGKLDVLAEDGRVPRSSLSAAVDLYCYRFPAEPQMRTEHGFNIGKRLTEMSFDASSLAQIETLYWRCISHHRDDIRFTEWYITQLHEKGEHKLAIKFFCLTYAKMSPTFASIEEVGTAVVESVVKAQGYKASKVLQTLAQHCSGEWNAGELHSTWVMKLLDAHWTWKHDLDETAALFTSLKQRGLKNVVRHPDGVWRVMIEIAYKAGRPDVADSYFKEAIAEKDVFETDYLTVMLLATLKAKAGDWAGVYQAIGGLGPKVFQDAYMGERVSRRLVPILKLYADNHTIAETDALVRRFITELRVPICQHLVTFMANEYGSVRDLTSLLAWLEYCAAQGFKVNATFTNAVLSSCRHTWKFCYKDLRNLYLKLKAAGEEYTDDYTERMMADAALSLASPKKEWRGHLRNLIGSTRIKTAKSVVMAGKACSADDIVLRMKEEIVLRRQQNAIKIYCRAVRQGFELPVPALHLAIKAALVTQDGGLETAWDLIRKAEKRGVDISSCTVRIIKAQLDRIDPALENEQKYQAIMRILDEAKQSGLCGDGFSDVVLNQAAHMCLKANNAGAAIKIAMTAAQAHEVGGKPSPCYNVYNFAVLLQAWTVRRDVRMLRHVVARAKAQLYWTDMFCLKALKNAGRTARGHRFPDGEVVALLDEAVEHCVRARDELRDEGLQLQSGALEIMRAAAEAQKKGGAFEDVLLAQRQDAQEMSASEEAKGMGADAVEELLMAKRHDTKGNMSLSSAKRRGARLKEEMERGREDDGLEGWDHLDKAFPSEEHAFD